MTAKRRAKPRAASAKTGGPDILGRLSAGEAASVLRALLQRHPDLRAEARALATETVSDVSLLAVADDVGQAVLQLDFDDLNGRAGRHSWGYVEPTEAAWELLEEEVEPFQDEMKRYLELGFEELARTYCQGILLGLYRVRAHRGNPVLDYAEDFPAEAAGNLLDVWIEVSQKSKRRVPAVSEDFVAEHIPDWNWVLRKGG